MKSPFSPMVQYILLFDLHGIEYSLVEIVLDTFIVRLIDKTIMLKCFTRNEYCAVQNLAI